MLKKLSIIAGTFLLALVAVRTADAAVLKNAYLQMSTAVETATGVTHTYRFYASGTDLGSIEFLYCLTASGTCNATGANLTGVAVPQAADIIDPGSNQDGTNWSVVGIPTTTSLELTRSTVMEDTATGNWRFDIKNISNPDFDSCGTTCYIRITTYSDTNTTNAVDSTVVSMTVTRAVTVSATVDPSFTLTVAGVAGGVTPPGSLSGLTTTADQATTATTIPFGNLTPGTPKYMAHLLTISTNASNGYSVTTRMNANMTGSAYGSDIDPFVGTGGNATDSVPQLWSAPNGTVSGTNSGWLGVATNETTVTNPLANGFYSLGSASPVTVVNSSSSANNDQVYVMYGIEVNNFQRADAYSGTLRFNALPVY